MHLDGVGADEDGLSEGDGAHILNALALHEDPIRGSAIPHFEHADAADIDARVDEINLVVRQMDVAANCVAAYHDHAGVQRPPREDRTLQIAYHDDGFRLSLSAYERGSRSVPEL